MYRDGVGVPQSFHRAIDYFLLSANQGNPAAQANLGLIRLPQPHLVS